MGLKLIFLEPTIAYAPVCAEAAVRLGFEPVFCVERDVATGLPDAVTLVRCDTVRVEHVMAALEAAELKEIAGVCALLDSRLVTALALSWRLGVNGPDPVVIRLRDRGAVADLLPEFSPPTLRFHRDFIPVDKIGRLLAVYGRLMVKPVQMSGATGCFSVTAVGEIEAGIHAVGSMSALDDGGWVVQAYCEGEVLAVDGYVQNGRVRVLSAGSRGEVSRQVDVAIEHLMRRAEFRNGYFSAEFVTEARGPALVEASVGCPGGDAALQRLSATLGLDPVALCMHVILNSIFPERAGSSFSDVGVARPSVE